MRTVFMVALLAWSASSFAATAYWTGQSEIVQTVTYETAINCEYNYGGQTFWQAYKNYCPPSVEVQ